ncbi:MAG: FAD-binding oxidoreductase [Pseudorhodobacter sp.]|nr:FAD-binding oxidoreductase [Pseudorhodobacter sp.]
MIENEKPYIARSLWTDTANPTPDCPVLTGAEETEVAVIGGGFTGFSAALHLAEAGVAVTLLEAETPGWGASGRNGGQVNPGLKEDPDAIEAKFGTDLGGRMVRLSGGAGDFVFNLIRRLEIDCAARQPGWIQPVHNEAALSTVGKRVDQWQRRGAPLRLLSRTETAELVGTDVYIGGMIDPRGGNLHPLNYALGLAWAAQKAGAQLHGSSPALRMEQDGAMQVIYTPNGRLSARKVLICTNGYSGSFNSGIARSVVPIRSVQVATAPLSDTVRKSILPGGHSASDSRRLLLYFRLDPEGRFIMGGRGDYTEKGTEKQFFLLREASQRLFPQLSGVSWAFKWGGFVAMTADHYPHVVRAGAHVWGALGYNGRGVAMATVLGKVLADLAQGVPEKALDFPVSEVKGIPFYFLRKPAVAAVVAWSRWRDG